MKVCVLRLGGLGDILLSTPTLRALAQHFATQEIDYIVGPGLEPTVAGLPYIRHAIPFDKRNDWGTSYPSFVQRLYHERYELFINLQPSVKTMSLALGALPRRLLIFRKDQRPQRPSGRLRHAIDDFAKEVLPLGVQVTDRQMDFPLTAAARSSADTLLQEYGIAPGQPFVALNPGASHPVNRWPTAHFATLIEQLADRHPELGRVVLGGYGDLPLVESLGQTAQAPFVSLANKMDIPTLGAVIARAAVVVTGDTGPQHIAAAVGTPLVSLFGPADPDRTGPLDVKALVVINTELDCVPCRKRTCRRGDNACLAQLAPERVLDAIQRSL